MIVTLPADGRQCFKRPEEGPAGETLFKIRLLWPLLCRATLWRPATTASYTYLIRV